MKRCSRCKQLKPLDEFNKDSGQKSGLACDCRSCSSKRQRDAYHANLEASRKRSRLNARLVNTGWSDADFQLAWASQKGRCEICSNKMVQGLVSQTSVCADHIEFDGKKIRRALLCSRCNSGIGLLGDSVTTLRSAIEYLNKYGARRP